MASILSPTPNLSVFWSDLSRAKSFLLIKPLMLSPTLTSKPLSEMTDTVQVTIEPLERLPNSVEVKSSVNCLIPSDILSFSISISKILAFTLVPFVKSLISSSPLPSQLMSDKWTNPSISSDKATNKPNSVMFLISPSIVSPILFSVLYFSHGLSMHCLIPSDILLF